MSISETLLTSPDPRDWKEDPSLTFYNLTGREPSTYLRRLFPFSAKVKKDGISGRQAGLLLKYARTKREATTFPIQVVMSTPSTWSGQAGVNVLSYSSEEMELLPPDEEGA
jgi:hypothetical protein